MWLKITARGTQQSVVQNFDNLDVVFITYDKLRALALSPDDTVIADLRAKFDILFMDEISQFAQKSSNSLNVYRVTKENEDSKEVVWSVFDDIEDEISSIMSMGRNETIENILWMLQTFLDEYKDIIDEWREAGRFESEEPFILKLESPLTVEQRLMLAEEFPAYYGQITQFATRENRHFPYTEKIIQLLLNDSWWLQNIPTFEKTLDYK